MCESVEARESELFMGQEIFHRDQVEEFAAMLVEEVEHVLLLTLLEAPEAT